ncbi:hypothetical protein [Tessaracoccus caeni]|uniref:hypothetical protein n=1 Tax=Tessaracoccus caeni TaxID=3031239 RepID=UPI0023DC24FF|nr:hypothetical protein [Tessaracoccus caeni]MDF1486998.1 hypothetical protein [Tessaracoccus caeni]
MTTRSLRVGVAALVAAALAMGGLVLGAAPVHAAGPVTITDAVSGATITLSSTKIKPGETIQISGTGFTPIQGSTGDPLVAVRPYDFDNGPAWTVGGTDAHFPANPSVPPASEAKYWFVTHHETGTFSGTLTAPSGLTAAGPLGNGQHWLRILSGAFFTSTGDRLTNPITFQVPFTVAQRKAELGLTSPTNVFQAGTIFRPGAQVTLRGEDFAPNQALEVAVVGTSISTTVTTDAEGSLPASARLALPADIALGAQVLRIGTGGEAVSVPFTVVAPPTATVVTSVVRPGGTIAYDLTGYIGVGGAAQKVAVVVSEQVLACIQTDAKGAASGTVTLPTTIADAVTVGFNVGLSCLLPPTGVINDQPISRIAPTLTVSDTAPAISVAEGSVGSSIAVVGSGFTANADVQVTLGSHSAGTLRADASGAVSGSVTAPSSAGTFRALASDGTNVAATSVVVAPQSTFTVASVTITGSAKVGKTLTAKGSWQPSPDAVSYQWNRDGKAIKGATKSSYLATSSDSGAQISVTVTGTKSGYTAASATSSSVKVTKGALTSATPKISGTAKVGKKLTAKAGTWTKSTKLTYQWKRDGKSIKGATKSSYTLTAGDLKKKITVTVTGKLSGYTTVAKTSKATAKVATGTLTSATPKISGTAKVGKKLTAKAGTWTKGTTLSYQWYANGKALKGKTGKTLTLSSSVKGKKVTLKVTGAKSGYSKVTKTSKATAKVT